MTTLYDDTYTGPRFVYGYTNRPFAYAHQPKGFIEGSYKPENKPTSRCRWGTIEYPAQLSAEDIAAFELVDLQARRTVNKVAITKAVKMATFEDAFEFTQEAHGITNGNVAIRYIEDLMYDWDETPVKIRAEKFLAWIVAELETGDVK